MNNVGVVENNAEMMMIKELVDKLNYHTKLYDQGKPIISDEEWDKMYFELVKLENLSISILNSLSNISLILEINNKPFKFKLE